MHDRLAEIGTPVSSPAELTPVEMSLTLSRRDTYLVAKATDNPHVDEVDSNEGKSRASSAV